MPSTSTERLLVASPLRLGRTIVAPIQLQLSDSDTVTVRYKTVKTGTDQNIYLSYRMLDAKGELLDGLETIAVNADGFTHSVTFGLAAGFLLSMTATSGYASWIGEQWIQVYISKRSNTNASLTSPIDVVVLPLLQGFITVAQKLAWPNSLFQQPNNEDGWYPARYTVASPAAGTNWNITVPASVGWKLVSVTALFVADANVANRQVTMFVCDPSATVFYWLSPRSPAITALQTVRLCWSTGTTSAGTLNPDIWNAQVPDMLLFGSSEKVQVGCLNLQAGDQWSAIQIRVLERIV